MSRCDAILGIRTASFPSGDIGNICNTFLKFDESENSKIFPNEAFGYWKVTVDRAIENRGHRSKPGV